MTMDPTKGAEPSPAAAAAFWKNNLRDFGLLGSLIVIMAFFEYLTGGVLLQPVNITNLILQNSYVVIMALGMLLVIVGGNIDLSIGSVVGFVGAISATAMVVFGVPWEVVIPGALILGGLIGAAKPAAALQIHQVNAAFVQERGDAVA